MNLFMTGSEFSEAMLMDKKIELQEQDSKDEVAPMGMLKMDPREELVLLEEAEVEKEVISISTEQKITAKPDIKSDKKY